MDDSTTLYQHTDTKISILGKKEPQHFRFVKNTGEVNMKGSWDDIKGRKVHAIKNPKSIIPSSNDT